MFDVQTTIARLRGLGVPDEALKPVEQWLAQRNAGTLLTPVEPDRCRSCQAPIRWAVTGANKRAIPLDLEPTADGNVELVDGYAITWGTSHDWPAGVDRYRSHFTTCAQAGEWRKKK